MIVILDFLALLRLLQFRSLHQPRRLFAAIFLLNHSFRYSLFLLWIVLPEACHILYRFLWRNIVLSIQNCPLLSFDSPGIQPILTKSVFFFVSLFMIYLYFDYILWVGNWLNCYIIWVFKDWCFIDCYCGSVLFIHRNFGAKSFGFWFVTYYWMVYVRKI